jgi:hypothetical protein
MGAPSTTSSVSGWILTVVVYEQTIGVANPSAYTRWSMASLDVVFTLGGMLFGWAALQAGLSRRRTTPSLAS